MRLRRSSEERGAIAVMFALLLTLLVTVAAIVVDIGQAQLQVRDTQQFADLAALAGARELPLAPRSACGNALDYVRANVSEFPAGATMPCTSIPVVCVPGVSTPANYTSSGGGDYVLTIRYPVEDAAIAPAQLNDGTNPCERMKVSISQRRKSLFAGIVGVSSSTIDSSAVVRSSPRVSDPRLVALLLLEPWDCETLVASGQAQIIVTWSADGQHPGRIGLDTDGSTCAGRNQIWSIDAYGEINSLIEAKNSPNGQKGVITLFSMIRGQTRCDAPYLQACEQDDVNDARLVPLPTRQTSRVTRSPINNRYNCKVSYPAYHGVPINGCPLAGSSEPYIDNLVAGIGNGTGLPAQGGFLDYRNTPLPNYPGGGPCTTQASDPAVVLPPGNWWINCTGQHGLVVKNTFIVQGGNVVLQNGIQVAQSANFLMNCGAVDWATESCTSPNPTAALPDTCRLSLCLAQSSADAAYLYIRNGELDKNATGNMFLNNTMVYLANASDGHTEINGGTGRLVWRAPFEGPFEDLALWSEGTPEHLFGGQAQLVADGIYFTPEADPFNFSGQGTQYVIEAQFVSRKLIVTGQGQLTLRPTYDRSVPIYASGVELIR